MKLDLASRAHSGIARFLRKFREKARLNFSFDFYLLSRKDLVRTGVPSGEDKAYASAPGRLAGAEEFIARVTRTFFVIFRRTGGGSQPGSPSTTVRLMYFVLDVYFLS